MHVKKIKSGHGLENVIEPLLVWLQQEELGPEAFGWNGILDIFVCKDIEQMEI